MNDPALLPLALRLVRRELRGGLRGFGVFLACLFLGVFAISAVGSFSAAARAGLASDARALLGGDLELRLAHREVDARQRSFLAARGVLSTTSSLRAMAFAAAGEERTLVEVKAIDTGYPLYGRLDSLPPVPGGTAPAAWLGADGALAESALLERLGLQVGDRLRVGEARFVLRGVLNREPDRRIRAFTLGPRLLVSQAGLAATGLLQPGSLVTYAYRLRLPAGSDTAPLLRELRERFPEAGWRLRSWREAAPRVRFFLDRMDLNLTLIGLSALLVGGLGVAGAVRGYLGGKVLHIATMKCVGAGSRVIFTTYLLQILLLGLLGCLAGLLAGALTPYLVAWAVGERLPVPLQPGLFPGELVTAALFGLLVALLFSLKALGSARLIPPAVLFRGYAGGGRRSPGRSIWLAITAGAGLLALLALLTSSDRRLALWYLLGAAGCFFLFRLLANAIVALARRLPRAGDPRLRLGVANLHRRGSPAPSAVFSLGLGLTVLVIITQVQGNLTELVSRTIPKEAPAFFLLDIQADQIGPLSRLATGYPGVTRLDKYPTLRGRIEKINGVAVAEARIDPAARWAVRGDRFLSYSAELPAGTVLTAGNWWPAGRAQRPLVSLTADLGRGFGVAVGDTLTVNVLGREVTAEIANFRQVDWSTLELNFALLFAPGLLESAPQTYIATAYVDPAAETGLFRAVTGTFPNVSVIGTREVLANVNRTLERLGGGFRAMAGVVLLTGFLVLAGAVSADQHRRIGDAVLLKVCGATRRDILGIFAVEFGLLGVAAGVISLLVGSAAAYGILEGLMKVDFSWQPLAIGATLVAGILLVLLFGLAGTWKALGQKPAGYLRQEST